MNRFPQFRRLAAAAVALFALSWAMPVPALADGAVTSGATTAVTASSCSGVTACAHAMLAIINRERERHRLAPLTLATTQSSGDPACAGSLGHSTAMASSGTIWHVDAHYPRASFPRNICLHYRTVGENVGMAASGNELNDLQTLNHLMMQEPHSRAFCVGSFNHACNLLNPSYRHVGIGIYTANGATWLTEDFIG